MAGSDDGLDWLRAAVAVMRELGVVSWSGIVLGPEVQRPTVGGEMTPEERARRLEEMRNQRARVQYAHSRVRPKDVG